ncbi:DegV family protein [Halanaerobium salsuginis]|uniref:DhaL domain-containing protein n=1 Tax=Halanaerobium salsuginis TaxID=29563 RepID=A0A1I4L2H8_9FIRM|nr:DegV family protein [Halanaerobium salsuginis]SFL85230.1 hypothetical protein SAMN02983006_02194 [Halanaerobium salsuginis]
MKINYLDGKRAYSAFLAGANRVISQQQYLNEINLFPVSDGDTGSNLTYTLSTICRESTSQKSLAALFTELGKIALQGALGNSGIIFAQFINGFAKNLDKAEKIKLIKFAETVEAAVDYTYRSLANPVEGTILTVMKAWADSLKNQSRQTQDFVVALEKSLIKARYSLNQTTQQLEVLRKAAVVDAGAKAFVLFLTGIIDLIHKGTLANQNFEFAGNIADQLAKYSREELSSAEFANKKIEFRYCTEAYLENLQTTVVELKDKLKGLGNSLLVAQSGQRTRIHIHTNIPARIFNILAAESSFIKQKVDDMQLQQAVKYNQHSKIALLTDSIADLPQDFKDKHQIHILPLNILIGGEKFIDRLAIKASDLFELTSKLPEFPTSAQPTPETINRKLTYLAEYYDSIIVITVSSAMSGLYSAVKKAANKLISTAEISQIEVIDSKTNSAAQGLLVMEAAKKIAEGKSFTEIVSFLKAVRNKLYIYVSVSDFKYMIRGGRIKSWKGKLANLINLHPIISIDSKGQGMIKTRSFSKKANLNKIKNILKKHEEKNGIANLAIVHGNDQQRAHEFEQMINNLLNVKVEFVEEISSVVALNAGSGSTAVALLEK